MRGSTFRRRKRKVNVIVDKGEPKVLLKKYGKNVNVIIIIIY